MTCNELDLCQRVERLEAAIRDKPVEPQQPSESVAEIRYEAAGLNAGSRQNMMNRWADELEQVTQQRNGLLSTVHEKRLIAAAKLAECEKRFEEMKELHRVAFKRAIQRQDKIAELEAKLAQQAGAAECDWEAMGSIIRFWNNQRGDPIYTAKAVIAAYEKSKTEGGKDGD